jgi:hypothetical protein
VDAAAQAVGPPEACAAGDFFPLTRKCPEVGRTYSAFSCIMFQIRHAFVKINSKILESARALENDPTLTDRSIYKSSKIH